MPKIIAAILIIALIITLGVLEQVFIYNSFNELTDKAETIRVELENEDYDSAEIHVNELMEWWRKKRDIIELTSPHNEVKDHIAYIAQMQGYISTGSYDDAIATAHIIKEDAQNKLNILGYKVKNVL